jgi:hypothetical protein
MKNFIAILILFLLGGCIKPFDQEVDEGEKKLVVNGLITDEPGPYTVKLNKTTSYGGYFSTIDPSIDGALVIISDETGAKETLKQVREGEFQTSAGGIRGRIGGVYTLYVRLKNGQEFTSEPETLNPVPAIDRLYYGLKEVTTLDETKNELKSYSFEIKIDTKDPGTERNFYRWTTIGTYEVDTQPENYTELDKRGNPIPKPKACCRQCWLTRTDFTANVRDDRQFNGNALIGQPVTTIPITPQFMGIKYHINLKQYSISEKAFNFWQMLSTQSTGTGSVQDPAPANPQSNVHNTADPNQIVLGYFGASAVVTKTMFIGRTEVPVSLDRYIYPDDCRTLPSATTTKPAFWQ